ncbi:MAG TPA: hypothetical protein PKE03_06990 [Bacteroidales bacterium]|nr:hypothetical protein [Bacteroidales bacterium]
MKVFPLLPLLVLCTLFTACNDQQIVAPAECRIQTFARKNPRESISVTYELKANGQYQLARWYYYGPQGRVSFENPQTPLSVTVVLGANDSIYAGAIGQVTEGSLRVSYRAVAADTLIEASDLCIQSLNTTPLMP